MATRIQPIDLQQAGIFGLNTETRFAGNDFRWLSEGLNLVYDELGRLTSRKGLNPLTTTGAHAADTEQIFEYIKDATTSEIISSAGLKIYKGTETLTDITGTITTPTANDWKFLNFNGKCIGVQQGHTPIVYTGTSFANITAASGSLPTGNCGASAFARLWLADADKTTIKFSATLDETHWLTGAGSINTLDVWPDGIDTVSAIVEWQDRLLIFGTRSILVYVGAEDPSASTFQLDDILRIGTDFRDSVIPFENDLIFMHDDGLHSINRAIDFSSFPLSRVTDHVTTQLVREINAATRIVGTYSPVDKALLYAIETANATLYWYFDIVSRLQDGGLRAMQWSQIGYTAIFTDSNSTVYLGMNGKVADHSGYQDDGSAYSASWITTAADLGTVQEKIVKSARYVVTCNANTQMIARWSTDFGNTEQTYTRTIDCGIGTAAEWNDAEWGPANPGNPAGDEWSGGASRLEQLHIPLSGSGGYFQIGARASINGAQFLWSALSLFAKTGRLAA